MRMLTSFLIGTILVPTLLTAQSVSEDFEEWSSQGTVAQSVPIGWSRSADGCARTDSPFGGMSAVVVWNWYYYATGYLFAGESENARIGDTQDLPGGMAIDFTPTTLTGYYRYIRGQNGGREPKDDSGAVLIALKRYDAGLGRSRTISSIKYLLGPSDQWRRFTVPIPAPLSGEQPDSVSIVFASSDPDQGAFCGPDSANCCYLHIDEIALTATSDVSEYSPVGGLQQVLVTPNPARETITFRLSETSGGPYRFLIFDAAGERVEELEVTGPVTELNWIGRPSGAFFYRALTPDGTEICRGKFIVQ